VGHEQRRFDVSRELAQVGVRPGRRHAAVDAGALALPIPPDAESVAVGRLRAHPGVKALVDDPVLRIEQQLLDQHRLPEPSHPAAHRTPLAS
jgi:hypothetical protein